MNRNYQVILTFLAIIIFTAGCTGNRDASFYGKWTATGIKINRWDGGDVPPGGEKIIELHEDGYGTIRKGNESHELNWHNDSHNLFIKIRGGDKSIHAYTFKDGKMTLDFPSEDLTYVFTHRKLN